MKYCTAFAAFLVSFIVFVAGSSGLRAQSITPGLGPAGNLAAIDIEQAGEPVLHGRDSRMQLLSSEECRVGEEGRSRGLRSE